MNWKTRLMTLGLGLLFVPQASAGDFWRKLLAPSQWGNCVGKFGCDDYERKCPPPHFRVQRFTCDDYHRKCPPPCFRVRCFECDDYCRKPFHFCCPPVHRFTRPPFISERKVAGTAAPSAGLVTPAPRYFTEPPREPVQQVKRFRD